MPEFLLENDFLLALIAFALVLIPAIIIHELGHFFAARIIGVSVLEFGVGFPPRLVRLFTWRETEFTLNVIPLGGFVRPLGEDMIGPVAEPGESTHENKAKNEHAWVSERDELRSRGVRDEDMLSVNEAKALPRIFFMAAGALANFASAIVIFVIIALLGLPQVVGGRAQVVEIADDSAWAQAGVRLGDAVELINGAYFENIQAFLSEYSSRAGERLSLTMRSAETGERYEIMIDSTAESYSAYVLVAGLAENSPAERAGLVPGDRILAVNGESLRSHPDPVLVLQEAVIEYAGRAILLTIMRTGETFDVTLTPRQDPPAGQGRLGIAIANQYQTNDGIVFGGAAEQQELIAQPVGRAIGYGFERFFTVIGLIASIPGQLIDGTISPEEARPVSIVGISQVGGEFLQRSIRQGSPVLILDFFALISIFLGITNLLPLPPLDGGRILFIFIEILRGRPVPIWIENLVYRVGIALLLSLGVVIILYDIFNPFQLPS